MDAHTDGASIPSPTPPPGTGDPRQGSLLKSSEKMGANGQCWEIGDGAGEGKL